MAITFLNEEPKEQRSRITFLDDPVTNPEAANDVLNNGLLINATPEQKDFIDRSMSKDDLEKETYRAWAENKYGRPFDDVMLDTHREYQYGAESTFSSANTENRRAAKFAKQTAIGEIPRGVARGTERTMGSTGSVTEAIGDYLTAQGRQFRNVFMGKGNVVGDAYRKLKGLSDKSTPDAIKPIKKGAGERVADTGIMIRKFWETAANTGWEERNPEIYKDDFLENPSLARVLGGVSESVPTMVGAMVLTANGMPGAGALLLAGSESAPVYSEAKEAGASKKEAFTYAFITMAGTYGLEKASLGVLTGQSKAATELLEKMGEKWVAGALINFVAEGSQESLQEMYQNAVAMGYDKSRKVFDGIVEAFITGGIMGTGAGAAHKIMTGFAKEQAEAQKEITDAPVAKEAVLPEMEMQPWTLGDANSINKETDAGERAKIVDNYVPLKDNPEGQQILSEVLDNPTPENVQELNNEIFPQEDQQDTQEPAEEEVEAPTIEEVSKEFESVVGISVERSNQMLEEMGLPKEEDPAEVRKHVDLIKEAKEAKRDVDLLLDDVKKHPRPLEDFEAADLFVETESVKAKIDESKQKIKDISETGDSAETGKAIEEKQFYEKRLEDLIRITRPAKTSAGRALSALRMHRKKAAFDLETSLDRATTAKKDTLTDEERTSVSDAVEKIEALEEEVQAPMFAEEDTVSGKSKEALAQEAEDLLSYIEKVHRPIVEQKKKDAKDKSEEQAAVDELKLILKQQDKVIDLINILRDKKMPDKADKKAVEDKEGYVEMAQALNKELRDQPFYKQYLKEKRAQREDLTNYEKLRQETIENIEQAKRSIKDAPTEQLPPSDQKVAYQNAKKLEKQQDVIFDLLDQLRKNEFALSDAAIEQDPEGYKAIIKNLRKEIADKKKLIEDQPSTAERKARLKALNEILEDLNHQYNNKYRPTRQRKYVDPEDIAAVKHQIRRVRDLMRITDELASVNEDLRLIALGRFSEVDSMKSNDRKVKAFEDVEKKKAELRRAKKHLNDIISRMHPNSALHMAGKIADFQRAMRLSLDSWVGRQGSKYLFSNPVITFNAWKESMPAYLSENYFYAADELMKQDPAYQRSVNDGIVYNDVDAAFEARQELINSRLAEKIPLVAGSNRNLALGINLLRHKLMKSVYSRFPNESAEFYQAYARFINEATGRGTLNGLEASAHALTRIFTAPRWTSANIKYVAAERHAWLDDGMGKKELNKTLLKEISKQRARMFMGVGSMMGALLAMGWDLEDDPEQSDFGKIRYGDFVLDLLPGFSTNLRIMALATESAASQFAMGELEGDGDVRTVVKNYFSYKTVPWMQQAFELMTGETMIGDDRNLAETMILNTLPIMVESYYQDSIKDGYDAEEVASSLIVQWFGTGSALYEDKD